VPAGKAPSRACAGLPQRIGSVASDAGGLALCGAKVPGDYINVGNGEASAPMHNHPYDFSDEAIPYEIRSIGD
jgi:hypothetical protein